MSEIDPASFAAAFDLLPRLAAIVSGIHSDADNEDVAVLVHQLAQQISACSALLRESEAADVPEAEQLSRIATLKAVLAQQRSVPSSYIQGFGSSTALTFLKTAAYVYHPTVTA